VRSSIAKQRVRGGFPASFQSPFFAFLSAGPCVADKRIIMNALSRISGKRRELWGSNGFSAARPTIPVPSERTLVITRPSGIIRGFNQNHPKLRAITQTQRGGR
jgi:hypothetical protein